MANGVEIVLASGNPHKLEELSAIFGSLAPGVRLAGLREASAGRSLPEPAEVGLTFEENARIKALEYAAATGRMCLADDSGLEIDALGGRPGVISSHYATDGRETGASRAERDAAINARVMRELAGVPAARRTARFVCVMVLAEPGRVLATARGTFEGRIGEEGQVPRGEGGFGYDPLFLVGPGFDRTSAELSPTEKNERSHRGRAAAAMAGRLAALNIGGEAITEDNR